MNVDSNLQLNRSKDGKTWGFSLHVKGMSEEVLLDTLDGLIKGQLSWWSLIVDALRFMAPELAAQAQARGVIIEAAQ